MRVFVHTLRNPSTNTFVTKVRRTQHAGNDFLGYDGWQLFSVTETTDKLFVGYPD